MNLRPFTVGLILCSPLACILLCRWEMQTNFNTHCVGHLKHAANASTTELAIQELEIAIGYLEHHQMTDGYTSIVWRTTDDDMSFWYTNIKQSLEQLKSLPPNTSVLEKTVVLIKLRQTLLDTNSEVVYPSGASRFPYNTTWWFCTFLSVVFLVVGAIMAILLAVIRVD